MTTRNINTHKVNPANDELDILVVDEPGAGGANHYYEISGLNPNTNDDTPDYIQIHFQNGPVLENGINGLTQEVLLAIVIDRLECFQKGPYANTYNEQALIHTKAALASLLQRTKDRMARGVEGTYQK